MQKIWEQKITAIVEANDLNIMEFDEIHGFLTTHEMILQYNNQEITRKKKWVALISNHKSNSKSESSSEDEDMDLLIKKFQKFLKEKVW